MFIAMHCRANDALGHKYCDMVFRCNVFFETCVVHAQPIGQCVLVLCRLLVVVENHA